MMLKPLVTVEHASRAVPREYNSIFALARDVVDSHRGFDAGALELGHVLGGVLKTRPVNASVTRLLCDANRTERHPEVFSEFSRTLCVKERAELLRRFHRPHFELITRRVSAALDRGHGVAHFAAHSFTPVLHGVVRQVDIGILFDPRSPLESAIVEQLYPLLLKKLPKIRVLQNEPYTGVSNSLPTLLRRRFGRTCYAGIEIELNQSLLDSPLHFSRLIREVAVATRVSLLQM